MSDSGFDVMRELSYLAFITDTTRVISFEWSREAGGYAGGGENHHELSHKKNLRQPPEGPPQISSSVVPNYSGQA
jgi:hypothetical protein